MTAKSAFKSHFNSTASLRLTLVNCTGWLQDCSKCAQCNVGILHFKFTFHKHSFALHSAQSWLNQPVPMLLYDQMRETKQTVWETDIKKSLLQANMRKLAPFFLSFYISLQEESTLFNRSLQPRSATDNWVGYTLAAAATVSKETKRHTISTCKINLQMH